MFSDSVGACSHGDKLVECLRLAFHREVLVGQGEPSPTATPPTPMDVLRALVWLDYAPASDKAVPIALAVRRFDQPAGPGAAPCCIRIDLESAAAGRRPRRCGGRSTARERNDR